MTDRTVSTPEEIEALPDRTVLLDASGDVWQRRRRLSDKRWWTSYESEPVTSERLAKWAPLTVLTAEQVPRG